MNAARATPVLSALALLAALSLPAIAQGPIFPLAPPPVANNQAASAIFNAMLAISHAAATNPSAAQAATFPYAAAIQRYRAGDLSSAEQQALQAISLSAQPPTAAATAPNAAPLAPPVRIPAPGGALPGIVDPAEADAEAFLAVSRRALATCPESTPPARTALEQRYAEAVEANVAGRYNDVRTDAQAIIAACALPTSSTPAH